VTTINRSAIVSMLTFALWAALRIAVAHWYAPAIPLRYFTDVEIHALNVKPGLDLLLIPALVIGVVLASRTGRTTRDFVVALCSSALVLLLALSMALYPAAILSSRIHSVFRTPVTQSAAFALVAVVILLIIYWLTRTDRVQGEAK
jgi:hypothetical protein